MFKVFLPVVLSMYQLVSLSLNRSIYWSVCQRVTELYRSTFSFILHFRMIDDVRARKLAADLKQCSYYETCATYGLNVERVFQVRKSISYIFLASIFIIAKYYLLITLLILFPTPHSTPASFLLLGGVSPNHAVDSLCVFSSPPRRPQLPTKYSKPFRAIQRGILWKLLPGLIKNYLWDDLITEYRQPVVVWMFSRSF